MKVVLFCGGLGMRIRDYSDKIPKPMVEIGYRPILWHVMKYYAAYGHTDFVLCLGYKADVIKRYFVQYDEYLSNDFALRGSGNEVHLFHQDIREWNITFVDTGYDSSIGERLLQVERHVRDDEMFLANYSDNLTDFHLPDLVSRMQASDHVAGFLAVKPPHTYQRLIEERRLLALRYEGFWQNMDTFKDRSMLNDMHERGRAPWEIWRVR